LVEGAAGTSGSDFEQPTSTKETARVSNASSFIVYLLDWLSIDPGPLGRARCLRRESTKGTRDAKQ
jgi:hypothetical protein